MGEFLFIRLYTSSNKLSVVLALFTVESILVALAVGLKAIRLRTWSEVQNEPHSKIMNEATTMILFLLVVVLAGFASGLICVCGVAAALLIQNPLLMILAGCLVIMHISVVTFTFSSVVGDFDEFIVYSLYSKLFQRVVDVKASGPLTRRDSPPDGPVLAYALAVLALLPLPVVPLIGVLFAERAEVFNENGWVFVAWIFVQEVVLACLALFVARSYWGGCRWSVDSIDNAVWRVFILSIGWVLFGGWALFMVQTPFIYYDAGVRGLGMILFALSVMCSVVVAFMAASRSGIVWRRGLMNKLWSRIYHIAGQQFVQGRSDLFKIDGGTSLDSANKELLRMYSAKDRAELSVIAKQIINWGYGGSNSVG